MVLPASGPVSVCDIHLAKCRDAQTTVAWESQHYILQDFNGFCTFAWIASSEAHNSEESEYSMVYFRINRRVETLLLHDGYRGGILAF